MVNINMFEVILIIVDNILKNLISKLEKKGCYLVPRRSKHYGLYTLLVERPAYGFSIEPFSDKSKETFFWNNIINYVFMEKLKIISKRFHILADIY